MSQNLSITHALYIQGNFYWSLLAFGTSTWLSFTGCTSRTCCSVAPAVGTVHVKQISFNLHLYLSCNRATTSLNGPQANVVRP